MEKIKRRLFVKGISAATLSLPLAGLDGLLTLSTKYNLKNRYFSICFDRSTRRVIIYRANGTLLSGGVIQSVETDKGKLYLNDGKDKIKISSGKYNGPEGSGEILTLFSDDKKAGILSETRYIIYDNISCFSVETVITNTYNKDEIIRSIEPAVFAAERSGSLIWPGYTKVLTNGAMYYDAGMIHEPGSRFVEAEPYGPVKGSKINPDYGLSVDNIITSWWNVAFFSGYESEALVVGFAENKTGFGRIYLSNNSGSEYTVVCSSNFSEGLTLRPGERVTSSKVIFSTGNNPYNALGLYASLLKKINIERELSIVNGWCSWFYTYELVSEEEVIKNALFAKEHLKDYGLRYIQVDEGYQKYHGEWDANERFPTGLKSLAEKIKSLGLKPGIWIAPFVVSEPSELYRDHREWLLKDKDGELMRVGPWPDPDTDWARNEPVKRYGLDISHPGARKWLYDLFKKLSDEYGFEMFKIDFVAWTVLSAVRFYDPSYTPAIAYRRGMKIIRSAIGDDKHINDCGPGFITAGLIDSMRIEIDQNYGYSDASWKQYFTDSSSSAPAAAKRYYFHNNLWINDADHVCINSLPYPQAMSVASLISLFGGNIISGDRLFDLDKTKLEILKKVLPSSGMAARPVDLLDSDRQSVFALEIVKPFGKWTIAGLFNNTTGSMVNKSFTVSRLFLDQGKRYLVFDFWNGVLMDELYGVLKMDIQPGECYILAIHEKKPHPFVISTDRHILQGAIETIDVKWDSVNAALTGINEGVPGSSYNVFIWFPDGVEWKQDQRATYSDYENYSVRLVGKNLMKMRVYLNNATRVNWKIRF